jgi:glutamyl-tRNA synthetase
MTATTKTVRTRFAPSPTGFLHVGGVRTNFFAWLLARQSGGQFILRIEDTDRERLVPDAVRRIIEDLNWLGIDVDEGPSDEELRTAGYEMGEVRGFKNPYGPYIQSLKNARYKEVAEQLISSGHAYRCDCTPEQLEAERASQIAARVTPGYSGRCRTRNIPADKPHVVRLLIKENAEVVLNDAVKGPVKWTKLALRDLVLLKSDGFPTYHLACIVDDHDMKITHVIRGDEWLPTAPAHVLTYNALGWEAPIFCHLPPVLGDDGKKLSKRHGAADVLSFKQSGYLPDALLNYLLMLGWAPGDGDEQEIFTREEMFAKFSLKHVSTSGAVFSRQKLNWMSGIYLRKISAADLTKMIAPKVIEKFPQASAEQLAKITPHIQERLETLNDAPELVDFLFVDKLTYEIDSLAERGITDDAARSVVAAVTPALSVLSEFNHDSIGAAIKEVSKTLGVKSNIVYQTLRIAVTGREGTPPILDCMEVIGKDGCLRRIEGFAKVLG